MKVVIAPMKVGHDTEGSLVFLAGLKAKVYGLTEMDLGQTTALPAARRAFGRLARILTKNISAHSQEVPLIVRNAMLGYKSLSFEVLPGSPNVGVKGAGNDRVVVVHRFSLWGRVYTVIHGHSDSEVQDHDPRSAHYGDFFDNERMKVTRDYMKVLRAQVELAVRRSDAVIVMGDFNTLPVGAGTTDPDSVFTILRDNSFKVHNERVTVLAVWGAPFKTYRVFLPGKGGWGSDHAALLGTIARPRKRVG